MASSDHEKEPGGQDGPQAAIGRQMASQWTAMLGLMTQQGATRQEIMELTASTALVLIVTTADNLWPQGQAVHPELEQAAMFTAVQADLEGLVAYVRHAGEVAADVAATDEP